VRGRLPSLPSQRAEWTDQVLVRRLRERGLTKEPDIVTECYEAPRPAIPALGRREAAGEAAAGRRDAAPADAEGEGNEATAVFGGREDPDRDGGDPGGHSPRFGLAARNMKT